MVEPLSCLLTFEASLPPTTLAAQVVHIPLRHELGTSGHTYWRRGGEGEERKQCREYGGINNRS